MMYSHSIESFWHGLYDNAQSVARESKLSIASESPGCSAGDASSLLLAERSATTESAHHTPHQNHLLDALPLSDFERIASQLELVPMPLGEVLYESGEQVRHVYFPTTCILSLLYVMADGAAAEIAIVGNEGILGISLFMVVTPRPAAPLCKAGRHAFRLRADLLKDEFERFGPTMHFLLRYTQALITQMAQTAVCNRHHSVDQQLCRRLLLSLDRLLPYVAK